jgi:ATP-binding protein involved in chromosome partitioning
MDPRLAGIDRRLGEVGRILAVTGGKGGIGKSSVASILALVLAETRMRTGLLDLDLTGPSDHVILGLDGHFPTEGFGLEPPLVHGIRFMSVSYFLGQKPVPLRGADVTNAIIELLAVTHWGALDVLVIDMPPGLGDASLDLARLLRPAQYVVVAGRSRVVLETVRRMLRFLTDMRLPVAGVVENMARGQTEEVAQLARQFGAPFLGALPFDANIEDANGNAARISRTVLAGGLRQIRDRLLGHDPVAYGPGT